MGIISKIAPTSASIQKEYVKKRQRELYKNDPEKTARVQAAIESMLNFRQVQRDWYEVYLQIHRALQERDLTLNINARSWFGARNTYETYAQMYERASSNGRMALKDDKFNPAVPRAVVDDLVTLPEEWKYAQPFSQRKRLYNALSASGETDTKVNFGDTKYQAPKLVGDGATTGVDTKNKKFKSKAKQVFAALNYGRRVHGSNTYYGWSHLVLKPSLKQDAIYFPCDTFEIYKRGTKAQATFNTIGALIESPNIQLELYRSCVEGIRLEDTKSSMDLIEAHLFRKVKMNQDVEELVLSRQTDDANAISGDEWNTIKENAKAWCQRNNVRLVYVS